MRRQLRFVQMMRLLWLPSPISTGKAIQKGMPPIWSTQNDIGIFMRDFADGDEVFEVFTANLRTARELTGSTPLHLAFFPQRFQQSEREWAAQISYYALNPERFDLELPNRQLAKICSQEKLNCLDLLPAFRERGQELLHYPYDMHWNDAGNQLAGDVIADYLLEALRAAN